MHGLWIEDGSVRFRDDLPEPQPAEGEAVLQVLRAGVCNTDLELVRGYMPFVGVPGHEFVGVVEDGPSALAGKRVVGEINASCRRCATCRAGRPTHCPKRTVLGIVGRNGAMAERVTLPAVNLHPVPDGMDTDVAVFAEPLAAAFEIREQTDIGPSHHVLVVGDGKLGQLIARVLARTGCDLLVIGRHRSKLELLEDAGIATGLSCSVETGAYDVTVECTGNPEGFDLARRGLRPRGTLVLKSTYAGGFELDSASLVVDEINLLGSRCGPFKPALDFLASGEIDVRPLIDARFALEDGVEAFERAAASGVMKVLLDMPGAGETT